jgi:hypothetical protein
MAEILAGSLGVVGNLENPYSGRLTVRRFPFGDVEALYCAGEAPSPAQVLNAYLADDGSEVRFTDRQLLGLPPKPKPAPSSVPPESSPERVARRARQRCRWLVKAIGGDRMVTLTWRENMTDISEAKKALVKFVRLCNERFSGFQYVAVPELQERGAFHWHMGVRGFFPVDTLRGLWWRALGLRVRWHLGRPSVKLPCGTWSENPGIYSPGTVNLRSPQSRGQKRRTWQADRMAAYMAKYISKAIEGGQDGRASYSASRGIEWIAQRYAVRALTYVDVSTVFFGVLQSEGVSSPFLWAADDRRVLWASGVTSAGP